MKTIFASVFALLLSFQINSIRADGTVCTPACPNTGNPAQTLCLNNMCVDPTTIPCGLGGTLCQMGSVCTNNACAPITVTPATPDATSAVVPASTVPAPATDPSTVLCGTNTGTTIGTQCPTEQTCVNNLCVSTPVPCSAATPCAGTTKTLCVNGFCEAPTKVTCVAPGGTTAPITQICAGGACSALPTA